MFVNPHLSFNRNCEGAFHYVAMVVDRFGIPWMVNCDPAIS
jgi:hypothetical protein